MNWMEKKGLSGKIIRFISENNVRQGEPLPSERKLSEFFGSSRNSVREALRELEAQNIIEIRPGSGCYLKTSEIEIFANPETDMHQAAFQNLEARLAIDPDVIQLALERINEKEISSLKGMIVKLSRAILSRDTEAIIDEDNRFRLSLARCTKNRILSLVVRQLDQSNSAVWSIVHKLPDEDLNTIFGSYVKIINAVEARDSGAAKQAVRNQITMIFTYLRSLDSDDDELKLKESVNG